MGFRYRKRIKLSSGIHMNISKSGFGFNFGVRGANITKSSRGTFLNFGIPGTGISFRSKVGTSKSYGYNNIYSYSSSRDELALIGIIIMVILLILLLLIKPENILPYIVIVGSILLILILSFFVKEKPTKTEPDFRRIDSLENELRTKMESETDSEMIFFRSIILSEFSFKKEYLTPAINFYNNLPDNLKTAYSQMIDSFRNIKGEQFFSYKLHPVKTIDSKTIYSHDDEMLLARLFGNKDKIEYPYFSRLMQPDFNIMPTGLLLHKHEEIISILPYKQLELKYYPIYVSTTDNYKRASVAFNYWEHDNSDGSKDKRYKKNKQLNVYQCGCLEMVDGLFIFTDLDNSYDFFIKLEKLKLAFSECNIDFSSIPTTFVLTQSDGNYPQEIFNAEVLSSQIFQIMTTYKFTPVMRDVLDMIWKNNVTQVRLEEYLATMFKSLSDLKDESTRVILTYRILCRKNSKISESDTFNIKYLEKILQVSEDDVKQLEKSGFKLDDWKLTRVYKEKHEISDKSGDKKNDEPVDKTNVKSEYDIDYEPVYEEPETEESLFPIMSNDPNAAKS